MGMKSITAVGVLTLLTAILAVAPIDAALAQPDQPKSDLIREREAVALHVADARVIYEQRPGTHRSRPAIAIKLSAQSANHLGRFTQQQWGQKIDILVDEDVVVSPRVNEPILSGLVTLFGDFDFEHASTMTLRLKTGKAKLSVRVAQD